VHTLKILDHIKSKKTSSTLVTQSASTTALSGIPLDKSRNLLNILLTVHHSKKHNETNVMHFSFSLLRIKGLYMFRTLLAHPQEALHKLHFVYCVRIMSVGCVTIAVSLPHSCLFVLWHLTFTDPLLGRLVVNALKKDVITLIYKNLLPSSQKTKYLPMKRDKWLTKLSEIIDT
jgi:hypothetical protein